jgi:hypothetical protein
MFFKNKTVDKMDLEQHEQIEYAHLRIKQKKKLFSHFVIFLIGSVFLIVINKVLKIGEAHNWFLWAITFWSFLFVIHVFNVFITKRFIGQDWERKQREKLVSLQKQRIAALQKEIETEFPLTGINKE